MKIKKRINLYTAFPLVDPKNFFVKIGVNPLRFKQEINKESFLPKISGFPKSFLLQVEHELIINDEVNLFSTFLNEKDYEPIFNLAKQQYAEIYLYKFEMPIPELFVEYKGQDGLLSYEKFCALYQEAFKIPELGLKRLEFIQIT